RGFRVAGGAAGECKAGPVWRGEKKQKPTTPPKLSPPLLPQNTPPSAPASESGSMGFNVTSSSAVHADVTTVMPAIRAACLTHPDAVRNLSGGYRRPSQTIKGVATAQGSQVNIAVKNRAVHW